MDPDIPSAALPSDSALSYDPAVISSDSLRSATSPCPSFINIESVSGRNSPYIQSSYASDNGKHLLSAKPYSASHIPY